MYRYKLHLGPGQIQDLDKMRCSADKHSKQYIYANAILACDRGPLSKKPYLSYQQISDKFNIHLLTLLNIRKNFLIYGIEFLRNFNRTINCCDNISTRICIFCIAVSSKTPDAIN